MAAVHELNIPRKTAAKPTARRLKLTVEVVAKLGPGERVYDLGGPPGFFAQGLGDGKVSFRVIADIPAIARRFGMPKRTMERVVGRWPDDLSPKAARTLAADFVAQIKRGQDPAPKVVITPVASWTVQETYDKYFGSFMVRQGMPDSTKRTYGFNFQRLPPKWRTRPMREVITDTDSLKALHDSIKAGVRAKTKKTSLKPTTGENSANATLNLLAILANYARGSDTSLPVWASRAVDKFPTRSRNKEGMDLADLGSWWSEVQVVKNRTRLFMSVFMLATGLRPGNTMSATLDALNEAARTLHVPITKGHRPDREEYDRAFTIPLSDLAMDCIRRARALQLTPSALLFASPTGDEFAAPHLIHGKRRFKDGQLMRHTFQTVAEMDLGISLSVSARLLNHKIESQTAEYSNPLKIGEPLRAAVAKIGAAIAKEVKL
jgi:integrase